MSLTTLFLYRRQMGLTATGPDARTSYAITIASKAIEAFCGRTFALTTRRQWLDGTGFDRMLLLEWPITALNGVAISGLESITISSTFTQAAASTTDTGMNLAWFDSAGDSQSSTLAFATYKTMTTLAAAVNLVTGWTATVLSGCGAYPTVLLKPWMSGPCSTSTTISFFVPGQWVQARIASDSNRQIIRSSSWASYFNQVGGRDSRQPIFPEGNGNIFVWYTAGYTEPVDNPTSSALTTAGNVPEDLTAVANVVAKAAMDAANISAGGIQSESIGNYSYSLSGDMKSAVDSAIAANAQALMPYRRLA